MDLVLRPAISDLLWRRPAVARGFHHLLGSGFDQENKVDVDFVAGQAADVIRTLSHAAAERRRCNPPTGLTPMRPHPEHPPERPPP
ncbi:hypothetical protein [Streptomyces mirabilis]|uniref:hypothetical protein n=1 Tax=Streptomyces mirabilis TaxID=68239 RepID=UPI00332D24A7